MVDVSSEAVERHGRRIRRGEVIFRAGEPSGEMYVIHAGRVRIERRVAGEELCLAVLEAGDFFGEMGLLPSPRTVTAVADSDGLLVVIDAATFGRLFGESPELARRIIARLADRLRQLDERLCDSLTHDGPARVAEALLGLIGQGEPRAAGGIRLPEGVDDARLALRAGVLPSLVAGLREELGEQGILGRDPDGRWWVSASRDVEDFAEYRGLKRQADPLGLDELAALAGLERGQAVSLAERAIARRLSAGAGLQTPAQRYLELKLRFEVRRE